MYKNILVATDGSKLSMKAVTHAVGLARAVGAKLTGFYASPDYPMPAYADGVAYEPVSRKEYMTMCNKAADKVLDAVAQKSEAAGVKFAPVHTIASAPWVQSRKRRGRQRHATMSRPRSAGRAPKHSRSMTKTSSAPVFTPSCGDQRSPGIGR